MQRGKKGSMRHEKGQKELHAANSRHLTSADGSRWEQMDGRELVTTIAERQLWRRKSLKDEARGVLRPREFFDGSVLLPMCVVT
jgi:hypothetical protein